MSEFPSIPQDLLKINNEQTPPEQRQTGAEWAQARRGSQLQEISYFRKEAVAEKKRKNKWGESSCTAIADETEQTLALEDQIRKETAGMSIEQILALRKQELSIRCSTEEAQKIQNDRYEAFQTILTERFIDVSDEEHKRILRESV